MSVKVHLAAGGSWHRASGSTGVWVFYQRWFWFKPGGAVGRYSGCTEGSPLKGGTLEK